MRTTIATMFLAASLVAGEAAPKPADASKGNASAEVETLRKKAGEVFTIELPANHTTGYSWALDGKEDSKVVLKVSNDYAADARAPGTTGSGGTERWKFRAVKAGTTVLHFGYRRPWEKDAKPADERSIKVVVD